MTPSVSPTSSTNRASVAIPSDSKRQARQKESLFTTKYGLKHHSYEPEKAPYPLTYERDFIELESLDLGLIKHIRNGSASFLDSEQEPPERCLDLGCGTGTWVIEMATKIWKHTEFVGFDLVNVQIPLSLLEQSVSERITWSHGNFITNRLPFQEDEFDHVHLKNIAHGVPENKWGVLFEEIARILRPGGSVELIEDDVVFPSLPRWFTGPLRARTRRSTSVHISAGSPNDESVQHTQSVNAEPNHDHALLESLYNSVFEHRFINLKPTAVLPSYFTTYFRHVTIGPVLTFPMPPLPPLQPLPSRQQSIMSAYGALQLDGQDLRAPSLFPSPLATANHPFSMPLSSLTAASTDVSSTAPTSLACEVEPETNRCSIQTFGSDLTEKTELQTPDTPPKFFSISRSLSETLSPQKSPVEIFNLKQLEKLTERSLAMHLYKSYKTVLACQEAMWEELKDRIRNKKEELEPLGWEDDEEFEELQNRKKFERLIDRYRSDMRLRVALWCSLNDMGCPFPPRDPLTKAEMIEEERIREAMVAAKKYASSEDLRISSRSLRVLVGYTPI